ncbi:hypothetical protein DIPPA_21582 [Diplonema papillatum]|nr:hypothetical protein DIPPA_21582 [Diplonema papillatum]
MVFEKKSSLRQNANEPKIFSLSTPPLTAQPAPAGEGGEMSEEDDDDVVSSPLARSDDGAADGTRWRDKGEHFCGRARAPCPSDRRTSSTQRK